MGLDPSPPPLALHPTDRALCTLEIPHTLQKAHIYSKEPIYTPKEPICTTKEPIYTPNDPIYTPTDPIYTPTDPIYTPKSPYKHTREAI